MADDFKLTVVKSGKRVEIDELDPRYSIPKGKPDTSKLTDDKETEVIITEE